ncbi:CHASE2 domain-containing protein [Thiomicrospira pelophila]|uniref:CHASE2 domain-containing protein n=1 Tax=Thiomicrospira pelophila TaxID=934 RepID=UPI0004A72A7A|nr:adenylate/guanylate cyclase domain-containing protein [Thiomicrospira pelophila]
MTRVIIQVVLTLSVLLASLYITLYAPHLQEPFELKIKDQMMIWRGELPADPAIVIIDIDEQSLKEIGQWPWPRDQVSALLKGLADLDVGMIGLDVVFAEADNSSPKRVFERLGMQAENLPDFDAMLAQAVAETPTILGYVFIQNPDPVAPGDAPRSQAIIVERDKPDASYLFKPYRTVLNIPEVQNSAYSSGYFNTIPDTDGVVRSVPLVMEYDGMLFPALSLEMMRIILGENRLTIQYENNGVESVYIGDLRIPTDTHGRLLLSFRGESYRYEYISATDIIHGRIPAEQVAGKIALVGTSAAGLLDLRATPFDNVYPGVEVHATALDNILNQEFIAKPMWVLGADFLSIVFLSLVVGAMLIWLGSVAGFLVGASLFFGIGFGHYYAFTQQGLLLNTVMPMFVLVGLFLLGIVVNYFYESQQKARIKNRFAQKVSAAVVEELINHPDNLVLEGREQEVTIFFSDIRGFTHLSENMGSAQALIKLLNRYMTPMVEVITRYQGTVDKFIGDAIMAYWNAPLPIEQHADQALKAAIEQIFALDALNQQLTQEGLPNLKIGIGLNTGLSVVGEMGSIGRSDYTVIGDPVNLASRAEGLSKPYGAQIVLTEFTLAALQDPQQYKIRFLDKVRVKGKTQPVSVYECLGDKHQAWYDYQEPEAQRYNQAQDAYHQACFDEALRLFEALQNDYPQTLYAMYVERCQHYIENTPSDFDGVFTLSNK